MVAPVKPADLLYKPCWELHGGRPRTLLETLVTLQEGGGGGGGGERDVPAKPMFGGRFTI